MFEKIKAFLFKNTTPKQTVAKNAFWLSVSNFGGRLIKAAIIIYAARVLGAPEYGVFSYAVTLTGFLGFISDPGLNAVLMRDTSKSSEKDSDGIFGAIIILKIILIAFCAAFIVIVAPYFTFLPGAKILLPIAAIMLIFDASREFFISLLRSKEKMQWDAGIFLFTNLAIVIFGFIAMAYSQTAYALSWGYAVGLAFGAIFAVCVVWKDIKKALSRSSLKLISPILQSAWPFAITGAIGVLFTNTDILIISWMRSAADVGVYSAAIRIIQVLYLVPGVIQLSTLPLFSRLAKNDDAKFRIGLERTVGLIFLVSIPLTVGGVILGTQIMSFLFGGVFASGGPALKILLITLLVDYPGSVIVNAIFAYAHQKSLIISASIGGVLNVIFDLILIPRYGMTGSAIATLIAQVVTNCYLWYMMNKINAFSVIPRLGKVALSGIIMAGACAVLYVTGTSLILNVIISAIVYCLSLQLLGEPMLREVKTVFSRANV